MTDADRFWVRVDRSAGPDACWPWLGSLTKGYGRFGRTVNGAWVEQKAHRFSYELAVGPIPDGLLILHSCDNPPCVNPAHLRAGTTLDNASDRCKRGWGRGTTNPNARLTPAQVAKIRASTDRQVDLAARYGIGQSHVSRIQRGENWAYDGYVVRDPVVVTKGTQEALAL